MPPAANSQWRHKNKNKVATPKLRTAERQNAARTSSTAATHIIHV